MINAARICTALAVLVTLGAAADTPHIHLEYDLSARLVLQSPPTPDNLWERFEVETDRNLDRFFNARFHPLHTAQLFLQPNFSSRDIHDMTTRAARGSISRSASVALRDIAMELPIMTWLEGQRNFLVSVLLNSVNSVEEASVAPLDPSYRALERSWWNRLSNNRNFSFGLRPFRTSPYAFMSASIWNGDSLVMLTHVRYHYEDFADHRFELAFSFPLSSGISLDLGTAYHLARHYEAQNVVLKLAKQFTNGGIAHLGIEVQEHPRFVVGFAMQL